MVDIQCLNGRVIVKKNSKLRVLSIPLALSSCFNTESQFAAFFCCYRGYRKEQPKVLVDSGEPFAI